MASKLDSRRSTIQSWVNQGKVRQASGRVGPRSKVPMLNLSRWMRTELTAWQQQQPAVENSVSGGPSVVMKLDIEGAEYDVLPELIASRALCLVDYVYAEIHPRIFNISKADSAAWFRTLQANITAMRAAAQARGRPCPVELTQLDDETYANDNGLISPFS